MGWVFFYLISRRVYNYKVQNKILKNKVPIIQNRCSFQNTGGGRGLDPDFPRNQSKFLERPPALVLTR